MRQRKGHQTAKLSEGQSVRYDHDGEDTDTRGVKRKVSMSVSTLALLSLALAALVAQGVHSAAQRSSSEANLGDEKVASHGLCSHFPAGHSTGLPSSK